MGTTIRPELSEKNKYYISKHRYYELKHRCLQYPEWKRIVSDTLQGRTTSVIRISHNHPIADPTTKNALVIHIYGRRIDAVYSACEEADKSLAKYLLMAVTEGYSYSALKAKYNIPCSKDMWYDRYHKFFWILDKKLELDEEQWLS